MLYITNISIVGFLVLFAVQKKPVKIDEVHYLQRFAEGWKDGKWEHRIEERECIERTGFHEVLGMGLMLYKI